MQAILLETRSSDLIPSILHEWQQRHQMKENTME
jgi:hypothetical protein